MKTLSQYPGLIGEVLERAKVRKERQGRRARVWRGLLWEWILPTLFVTAMVLAFVLGFRLAASCLEVWL